MATVRIVDLAGPVGNDWVLQNKRLPLLLAADTGAKARRILPRPGAASRARAIQSVVSRICTHPLIVSEPLLVFLRDQFPSNSRIAVTKSTLGFVNDVALLRVRRQRGYTDLISPGI